MPRQSPQLLHRRFERWAEATPDAVAVEFGDDTLTYADCNRRANRLAAHLSRSVPQDGHRIVGLCLERGPDMIVAVFAALKAGCAFLPLDPTYPPDRLRYMLQDAQPALVVTSRSASALLPATATPRIDLEGFADGEQVENPSDEPGQNDTAYIIYTSGTTGRPKGVLIGHEGLSSMGEYLPSLLGLVPSDRVLQFASFNFDAFIWELLCAFASGATLVTARREEVLPGPSLTRLLRGRAITMATLSPSVLAQVQDRDLPDLRILVCAGEACTRRIVNDWSVSRRFYNAYGPTEVTIAATYAQLSSASASPIIGTALPDKTVHLLDDALAPIAPGYVGEICVGGSGLAIGYLNKPALTAERFVRPPCLDGARVYRTGDLARVLPDGNLEYIGRRDEQIKIRGFRVELGEIETVLCQHDQVGGAAVVATHNAGGTHHLVAYLLLSNPELSSSVDPLSLADDSPVMKDPVLGGEIRAHARRALPDYMVPAEFVLLKRLPLTPHGKVDRQALAAIKTAPLHSHHVPPETETERQLVAIWQQALGLDDVGRFDHFFDLGGDSLALARIGVALESAFDITVPQHLLHSAPVLHHLARSIELLRAGDEDDTLRRIKNVDVKAEASQILRLRITGRRVAPTGSAVFLTGATGFLGSFLLHRLLLKTSADVFCLVRASNALRGKDRLREALAKYGLSHPEFEARVWSIPGDVTTPMFGLTPMAFVRLSEMIGAIYHSAAVLDWIAPYDQIKDANVVGTRHVLELATRTAAIPFHHISSIGVLLAANRSGTELEESLPLDAVAEHRMGYLQTKWVAERMVQHLGDRLPVAVYRPPFVTGDSTSGAYNTEHDFLAHKIKACAEMQLAPTSGFPVDMTPVDYLADAILYLSTQTAWEGQVFHFSNPRPLRWPDWCDLMEGLGYPLRRLPYRDWVEAIVRQGPGNALYRLLPFLTDRGPREQQTLYRSFHDFTIRDDRTRAALAGANLDCPSTSQLAELYLPALTKAGFLPPARPLSA